jgi:hypothetical protein
MVFLKDADDRGKALNKKVFCYAVGLGLGVWKLLNIQNKFTIEVYLDILANYKFNYISDLYFGWFDLLKNELKEILDNYKGNIKIHFGNRNPADKLIENNSNSSKLLVCNWPWDSNSYIGNEYWEHNLAASGDPAAASCSYIAYIGDPKNIKFVKKI